MAIVVVAAVLLVGGSGDSNAPPAPGSARLTFPTEAWSYSGARLKGLGVEEPTLLSRGGIIVNAGALRYPGEGAGAVPPALITNYGRPAEAHLVNLTLGPARNYTWTDRASGPFSLYVIATSSGELALACGDPQLQALGPVARVCAKLANEARVVAAKVEYPGADPALARQLVSALSPRGEAAAAARLGSPRLRARASALTALAAADVLSATRVQQTPAAVRYARQVQALATELEHEGNALSRLADAARAGGRSGYEAERKALDAGAPSLERAFRALTRQGFALPRAEAIGIPPAPSTAPA